MSAKRLRLPRWLARTWARVKQVATYQVWHTGLQPSVPQLKAYKTRRGKVLKRAAFKLRKLARFTQWHTGLQPNPVVKMATRPRRKVRGSWQLRKIARYFQWHTGFNSVNPPNPIQNLKLKTRKRKQLTRGERPKLRQYQVWHTGQFTLSPVVHFVSHRRKTLTVSRRRRQSNFSLLFHTGLSPVVSNKYSWVSLGIGTGANRHGSWS